MPTISPARTLERHAAHLLDPAVVDDVQVLDLEQHVARAAAAGFSTRSSTSRPTIARASDSSVAPSRGTVSIFLPRRSTVIRSAISSTSFSLWLMKMIDLPSACRLLHDREQLGRLLRRQHRRRLVEDQDLGAAVERLQDLDALLLADGDLARSSAVGSTARPNCCESSRTRSLRAALVEQDPVPRRLDAEHDVLGDRHHRDQHEVLVHHPDPGVDRVLRRART